MKVLSRILMAAAALGVVATLGLYAPETSPATANPMKANYAQYERIQTNMYVDRK
ncbi:hypothetical protein [Paenibacillus hamazuiensis]|uniref:hypothetical protein n=1 Tax=Paenibacillus hamazuiensis TaxID=2936508 RepID=UPI00200BE611|nr:hypothetical protein [Paenibacillus hamazuiensis]